MQLKLIPNLEKELKNNAILSATKQNKYLWNNMNESFIHYAEWKNLDSNRSTYSVLSFFPPYFHLHKILEKRKLTYSNKENQCLPWAGAGDALCREAEENVAGDGNVLCRDAVMVTFVHTVVAACKWHLYTAGQSKRRYMLIVKGPVQMINSTVF